ncbi:HET-domain-containing protein [Hypoxylon sp. FL1150]|nr:HET-domain-containing protein [Hypoxylon sp. FL1150]
MSAVTSTEQLTRSRLSPEGRSEEDDCSEGRGIDGLEERYRAPAYPYRGLHGTEVRLVRIMRGTGIIECLIDQIPLSEVKFFYALSYVWGDGREKRTIMLEGLPFYVTKNLWEALHQIRERPDDIGYPEDYFWVDAICINQNDIRERSRQVPRMMDIYHNGHVIIWLGHSKKKSRDRGVEILFEKAKSMWIDWEPVDDDDRVVLRENFGHNYDIIIEAAAYVLQLPWFKRVWTIQEACLDTVPTLYVGRHSVHLDDFTKFFQVLATEHRSLYLCPGSTRMVCLDKIDRLYRSALFGWEDNPRCLETADILVTLLRLTGKKLASDPRDQLYGLLGLLRYFKEEDLPEELLPDYHLRCEEVYWNYAALLLRSLGDLRLLNSRRGELRDVPSWVPDFRYLSLGPESVYKPESLVRLSCNRRTLHLQGHIIGTFHDFIARCDLTDIMPRIGEIPAALPDRLRVFEKRILKPSASIRGATMENVFNELMESTTKIISITGKESLYQVYRRLSKSQGGKRSRSAKKKVTTDIRWKEEAIAGQVTTPYILLSDGTVLRVTREDADVRPRDVLCIFKGAQEPSLARAVGDHYIFLGRCEAKGGSLKGQTFGEAYWVDKNIQNIDLI